MLWFKNITSLKVENAKECYCCSTDVSNANRNRNLIQRPCHESDSVVDCRLTDPIAEPTTLTEEFVERMRLWTQAHCKYHAQKPCKSNGTSGDAARTAKNGKLEKKSQRFETRE